MVDSKQPPIDQDMQKKERSLFVRIIVAILWLLPCLILINMFVGALIGGFSSANTTSYKEGYDAGYNGSRAFFQQYGRIVYIGELVTWLWLSFAGILPGTARFTKAGK